MADAADTDAAADDFRSEMAARIRAIDAALFPPVSEEILTLREYRALLALVILDAAARRNLPIVPLVMALY